MNGAQPDRPAKRVLVVDDDPMIRESVQWLLEDEGLSVLTAADGKQAVERVVAGTPDLVVLDMGLPLLSGEEVVATLRASHHHVPPIVVVTAGGWAAEKAARVGAAAYLPKPFDLDELLYVIRRELDRA